MEAIHIDWVNGSPALPAKETPQNQIKKENIQIGQITSFLVGAESRISALGLLREINNFKKEFKGYYDYIRSTTRRYN